MGQNLFHHILGNKHPQTIYFRVPSVSGFLLITKEIIYNLRHVTKADGLDSWESGAMQTPRMWQKHCSIVVPPLPFLLKHIFFCHGFPAFPSKYCNFPRFRSQRAILYQTTTKILITLLPLQFSTVRKHYEALHIVNPLFLPLRTRHWDLFQH
jgi:hypothetical protein